MSETSTRPDSAPGREQGAPASEQGAPASDDQQAIAEYYASRTYELTHSRPKRFRRPPDRPVWPDRILSPTTSFGVGLAGLSLVLLATGALAPMLHQMVLFAVDPGNNFVAHTVLDQTIMFPAFIGFIFAVVAPMFWYGSVLIRCALAALLVLPGVVAFYVALRSITSPEGYWVTALAMFCFVGAIPVLVQLASKWTLSHSRTMEEMTTPVGTRSIMELTIVAALGCAIFLNVDTTEFIESLLFLTAVGALGSVAAIGMLIAFLRVGRRNLLAGGVAALFSFGTSFVYTGMLAFLEFGWAELPKMLVSISLTAIYGMVVLWSIMWLYVWWLRSCGWACISKADEKQAREQESSEPWRYWFERGK